MSEFMYILAKSVDEVSTLLANDNTKIKLLSGGTDLISQLQEGKIHIDTVVDVKGVKELTRIEVTEKITFTGAAVTCFELSKNKELNNMFPGLLEGISIIGGVQIQGRASLGGNVCNASPAADSIPALIVHKAKCVIVSSERQRKVPIEEFFQGPGKTILQKKEFLVGFDIPIPDSIFGASYERFIPRNEMDIAVVGVGSSLAVDRDSGTISEARIALGAVGPTPIYAKESSKPLVGISIRDESIDQAIIESSKLAREASKPITDMRGSVSQRKHLTEVLTKRTLKKSVERAKIRLGNN